MAFTALNVTLFSIMSLAQWAGWGGLYQATNAAPWCAVSAAREAATLTGINLAFGLVVVAGSFAFKPMQRTRPTRLAATAMVCLLAALGRVAALQNVYTVPSGRTFFVTAWVAGFLAAFLAVSAGIVTAASICRARDELTVRMHETARAARAIEDLQTEEMRVRREVSDQLHGRLQHRLVTVAAGLDHTAARLDHADPATAAQIRSWAERIEEIREAEVRALSHSLLPTGVELGIIPAVDVILTRLPADIATSTAIGPRLRELNREAGPVLTIPERLAVVYTIEEAISNALRHGHATSVHITLEATPHPGNHCRWVLEGTVTDNGTGLPRPDPELTGLRRHTERLERAGGELRLARSPNGGTRLSLALPFTHPQAPHPQRPRGASTTDMFTTPELAHAFDCR